MRRASRNADRLLVVVRAPRLKTVEPSKGNGLGQKKLFLDPHNVRKSNRAKKASPSSTYCSCLKYSLKRIYNVGFDIELQVQRNWKETKIKPNKTTNPPRHAIDQLVS
jgi:hypothetical protein